MAFFASLDHAFGLDSVYAIHRQMRPGNIGLPMSKFCYLAFLHLRHE